MYANLSDIDVDAELERYKAIRDTFKPCVKDTAFILNDLVRNSSKKIIIEGANATMLDIDFGTYPFVTSSTCTIGGVCSGLGVPAKYVNEAIAIVKAYTTRVGEGGFATEQLNVSQRDDEVFSVVHSLNNLNSIRQDVGVHMQTVGKEVGVTTGRKRRCGWLDLVVVQYSNMINGFTS